MKNGLLPVWGESEFGKGGCRCEEKELQVGIAGGGERMATGRPATQRRHPTLGGHENLQPAADSRSRPRQLFCREVAHSRSKRFHRSYWPPAGCGCAMGSVELPGHVESVVNHETASTCRRAQRRTASRPRASARAGRHGQRPYIESPLPSVDAGQSGKVGRLAAAAPDGVSRTRWRFAAVCDGHSVQTATVSGAGHSRSKAARVWAQRGTRRS